MGRRRSAPARRWRDRAARSSASMPLWMTWTRSSATSNRRSTSARVPWLTAMTASADSSAVRSTQRGDVVAAAQLLALPRTQRLQRVDGDGQRDAVRLRTSRPAEVGVPGVAVHDVGGRRGRSPWPGQREKRRPGAAHPLVGHGQVVSRAGSLGRGSAARRSSWSPKVRMSRPIAFTQRARQLPHVNPRAAIDGGRVLVGQDQGGEIGRGHVTARGYAADARRRRLSPSRPRAGRAPPRARGTASGSRAPAARSRGDASNPRRCRRPPARGW